MIVPGLSVKAGNALLQVPANKLQFFSGSFDSQFFLQLPKRRFQEILSGRQMACRRNIILSRMGILAGAAFLQQHLPSILCIFSHQPDMGRAMEISVPVNQGTLLDLSSHLSVRCAYIKIFHYASCLSL